jgi:hypothetical protein
VVPHPVLTNALVEGRFSPASTRAAAPCAKKAAATAATFYDTALFQRIWRRARDSKRITAPLLLQHFVTIAKTGRPLGMPLARSGRGREADRGQRADAEEPCGLRHGARHEGRGTPPLRWPTRCHAPGMGEGSSSRTGIARRWPSPRCSHLTVRAPSPPGG